MCARPSSHRIKSFDSLGSQSSHSRTSKLLQSQYRSLVSKMFYYLIQRHLGHKGSTKVLGRMLGPMQTECGPPWAPSTAGWLLLCVVMCAFCRIPSDTEPGAFGHLFIWVYLEGCSSREVNALPSSPQVTLAVHMRTNSTFMHKSGHTERRGHGAGACGQTNPGCGAGTALRMHSTQKCSGVCSAVSLCLFVCNIPMKPPKPRVCDDP